MAELMAQNEGSAYICRTAVNDPPNVVKTKRAIKKALQTQAKGLGFSMVEVLSTCPTNWGLSPVEAMNWVEENMIPYYPLGEFKLKEEKELWKARNKFYLPGLAGSGLCLWASNSLYQSA